MYERFTDRARKVMQLANQEAQRFNHEYIGTEHILLGLVKEGFGRDLTELARQGKLDPVIGRQNEIDRVIQVLSRRTKNNPVLLGEAGVGKTAIVEGLAQLVVDSNVPELLRDRRIVVLDLAMMV